jgi:predicted alpha-1,2-mannosidase
LTCSCYSDISEKQPVDYVDPFLGTSSSRWMLFPGPCLPFGMVKLSPDNMDPTGMLDAGYEYTTESIAGFSNVHSWIMSGFITMPTTGKIKIKSGSEANPDEGYRSKFSHENEEATVGYYSVYLDDYAIKAELTATVRTGYERYTFPKSNNAHILFDLQIPEETDVKIISAEIAKVTDTEITGFVKRAHNMNDYPLYFVAQFNKPFDSLSGWKGNEMESDIEKISVHENLDIGALVNFSTERDEVVLMKTAISYVSLDQARLNMEVETKPFGWDFDAVHQNAREEWSKILNTIKVEGGSEQDKVKFYTGFYRSYSSRTLYSDINGKYMDMYENVQQLADPDSPVYGSDAFWNTFWNLNQLWSLATPDITNKWVNSLLEIYDKGAWLPKGPAGIEYTGVMVASHEIPIIVGAYQKGIRNFNVNKAFKAIKEVQINPGGKHDSGGTVGNLELEPYMEMGFIPIEKGHVSNTMEYAYDDWCVAQMAKSLGKSEDYTYFMQRSQNYKNVFDPSTGYFRPKHIGGPWLKHFAPVSKAVGKEDSFGGKDFKEGNAWQFSFFVPHDVNGLINLIGVNEFNKRLDEGFEQSRPNFVSEYINHGNQPNMQAAWLFNYSGKPWLTQKWVREILDNYYGSGHLDGYPGDEDQGQMGSWYVMGAIGLFQMDGGASTKPVYEIGSPIFEKITIQLDDKYYSGKEFVIRAKNTSKTNKYIQSATLNGKALNKFWIYHSELVKGGELVLEMGPEPNKEWAVNSPVTQVNDVEPIVTTPYVITHNKLFIGKTEIAMFCDTKGADIFYTLDGSEPTVKSKLYLQAFQIDKTTTIKMRAFVNERVSLSAEAIFEKAKLLKSKKFINVQPGLKYDYYTGSFFSVHDYTGMKPIKSGIAAKINTDLKDSKIYIGFYFEGYINIPKEGLYTFYLVSNDGSEMYLHNKLFIGNDGLHPAVESFKTVALKKGMHPVKIKYFQGAGGEILKLLWEGPDIEKQEVPASVLFHKN